MGALRTGELNAYGSFVREHSHLCKGAISRQNGSSGVLPNQQGIFARNPPLRKAVSWAIDRTAYARVGSAYGGSAWTHMLPPVAPGISSGPGQAAVLDEARPRQGAKARGWPHGDGHVRVAYSGSGWIRPAQAELVRADLIRLGFKPENVTVGNYDGGDL